MNRCVILSAGPVGDLTVLARMLRPDDRIIAADGGLALAHRLGVTPDTVVADFDSGSLDGVPEGTVVVRLPVKKDVTDTAAAVQLAVEQGYRDIVILGGTGGRLDHQYANMQLLVSLAQQNVRVVLADERNCIEAVTASPYTILPEQGRSFSLFAFGDPVHNLCITGALYSLQGYTLRSDDSLCISNSTMDAPCQVTFDSGVLLVFYSHD